MRRSERALTGKTDIEAVIRRSRVCRLGLCDEGQPYVVPLFFGYEEGKLYFHCAPEGRKLDIIRKNDRVCVEFDDLEAIVEAGQACGWSARYRSVIGFGRASVVEDAAERRKGLALLMKQYSGEGFSFSTDKIARTAVVRVDIEHLTGKRTADSTTVKRRRASGARSFNRPC